MPHLHAAQPGVPDYVVWAETMHAMYARGSEQSIHYNWIASTIPGRTLTRPTGRPLIEGDVIVSELESSVIGYRDVLEIFFATHDPTQLNRQGNDVGTQYRSSIFTHSDEQRKIALEVIDELQKEGIFDGKIVTEVTPLNGNYFAAEDYHQNYFEQHPNQGYCAFVVAPKVAKFRQKFAHRLKR